jgi:hypothetical protein
MYSKGSSNTALQESLRTGHLNLLLFWLDTPSYGMLQYSISGQRLSDSLLDINTCPYLKPPLPPHTHKAVSILARVKMNTH